MITQWVRAGKDWIALDEHKGVCGRLISLIDESITKHAKEPKNDSQKAREDMLEAKIKEYSRKRAERRREAKKKCSLMTDTSEGTKAAGR